MTIATEADAPGRRLMALLNLFLLDGGDPAEALAAFEEAETRLEHAKRMEAQFLLHQMTGEKRHLEAAHELLLFLVEHGYNIRRLNQAYFAFYGS